MASKTYHGSGPKEVIDRIVTCIADSSLILMNIQFACQQSYISRAALLTVTLPLTCKVSRHAPVLPAVTALTVRVHVTRTLPCVVNREKLNVEVECWGISRPYSSNS